jgi:hypothetical protein
MDISDILEDSSAIWHRQVSATPEAVRKLVVESRIELPEEYLTLMLHSNGGEGDLAIEPGWFQIWPAEQVIELNRGYEVEKNAPGFFAFGSDGGGEMLAFDIREGKPWKVVMIPFIPMTADHAVTIAEDFEAFVRAMGHKYDEG